MVCQFFNGGSFGGWLWPDKSAGMARSVVRKHFACYGLCQPKNRSLPRLGKGRLSSTRRLGSTRRLSQSRNRRWGSATLRPPLRSVSGGVGSANAFFGSGRLRRPHRIRKFADHENVRPNRDRRRKAGGRRRLPIVGRPAPPRPDMAQGHRCSALSEWQEAELARQLKRYLPDLPRQLAKPGCETRN